MVTDRNTKLTVLLFGLAGIMMSVTAVAEDRILITTEFPGESSPTRSVIEQRQGGFGGDSFISGGPTLHEPQRILFGPDDNLYVLDEPSGGAEGEYAVNRYDGVTGVFIDVFISAGANGLTEAKDMIFGPDGNLYVSVNGTGNDFCDGDDNDGAGAVRRYDGTDGTFIDTFVEGGDGNMAKGDDDDDDDDEERLCEAMGLVFTPAGDLLVGNDPSSGDENVLRFDGTTGAYIDTFVSPGDNGLDEPNFMIIGPDDNLYITNESPDVVLRYDGTTGAFIDIFVADESGGLDEPMGLAFGFDGNLYVVGGDSPGGIFRYDGSTGAFIDVVVPESNSNMRDSRSLLFFMVVSDIPVLSTWGMILLALGLVGLAGFVMVRRKRGAAA